MAIYVVIARNEVTKQSRDCRKPRASGWIASSLTLHAMTGLVQIANVCCKSDCRACIACKLYILYTHELELKKPEECVSDEKNATYYTSPYNYNFRNLM